MRLDWSTKVFSCWALCALGNLASAGPVPLAKSHGAVPSVFAYGSHFDIGWTIGATFAASTAYRVSQSGTVKTLKAWIQTPEGAAAYAAMLETANATFPHYVQEMEGIAYGSGVDFESIFILNCRNELEVLSGVYSTKNSLRHVRQSPSIEHCSDYLLHSTNGHIVVAHNEDGGKTARNTAFFVTAHVYGDDVREEVKKKQKKLMYRCCNIVNNPQLLAVAVVHWIHVPWRASIKCILLQSVRRWRQHEWAVPEHSTVWWFG